MGLIIFPKKGSIHSAPVATVKKASDYAVGESVFLMENGSPVEYLVVHQGLPSDLYDASCDGTWLLRKDIYKNEVQWNDSSLSNYPSSYVRNYLNGDFFTLFDSATQEAVKQVTIPYCVGNGVTTINSGSNGLSTKVFLLSGYECGWTTTTNPYFPIDGTCLDYFEGCADTDVKRIAYYNDVSCYWWLRSPYTAIGDNAWLVNINGTCGRSVVISLYGIRPALILDSNARFDPETNIIL